jgi:hypothetical protein
LQTAIAGSSVLNGLQNLDLLALLPDPQTVVRSALGQQLADDGLKDEALNPAIHGVRDGDKKD